MQVFQVITYSSFSSAVIAETKTRSIFSNKKEFNLKTIFDEIPGRSEVRGVGERGRKKSAVRGSATPSSRVCATHCTG